MSDVQKVLVLATNLRPPGGDMGVAAWSLQALRDEWDVTLLACEPPDIAGLNRHFGTSLRESDYRLRLAPRWLRRLFRLDPDPNSLQAASYLMRQCRRIGDQYVALLAFENEVDFGRPGIQYVHHPYIAKHLPALDVVHAASRLGRLGLFLRGRYRPWMWMSGMTSAGLKRNLTLVNSEWTRERVQEIYGNEPRTLYPPTFWSGAAIPFEERADRFMCLGRLEPAKQQLEAIEILELVRSQGFDVGLHIVGDVADAGYASQVRRRAALAGDWVRMDHGLSRQDLEMAVVECRYGLHAMREEHFGMAVAELVRAGCVVFLPDGGGQGEIVDHEPALLYGSREQAVERIRDVLSDRIEQIRLRRVLESQQRLFTETVFMEGLRETLRGFVQAGPVS
jgi:glycosyltransferase involved in cell wall biosynthesis